MPLADTADWVLLFHLFGAFMLVAGVVVAGVGFEAARRQSQPGDVALLLGLTRAGALLVAVGSMLVVPFGLWLVHVEHIGYGKAWVDAALALFVAVAVIGGLGGQRPKRARRVATKLTRDGDDATPELRALLDDRWAIAANYLAGVLLLAVIVLMVFKPGG